MVSVGGMYTTGSSFTVHYPHAGINYREHVGRCKRVEAGNLAVSAAIRKEDRADEQTPERD